MAFVSRQKVACLWHPLLIYISFSLKVFFMENKIFEMESCNFSSSRIVGEVTVELRTALITKGRKVGIFWTNLLYTFPRPNLVRVARDIQWRQVIIKFNYHWIRRKINIYIYMYTVGTFLGFKTHMEGTGLTIPPLT